MREYESLGPQANYMRGWLHECQESGTKAHRQRYENLPIKNDDVVKIENSFQKNSRKPLRAAIDEQGIQFSTMRNFLLKKLKVFPYKMSFLQQRPLEGYPLRLDYAQIIRRNLNNDFAYLGRIVFSHECIFHPDGDGIKHMATVSGLENSDAIEKVLVPSRRGMVWCGMDVTKIVGSHFLKQTVNGEEYKRILRWYAMPRTLHFPGSPSFQRNGDPLHWTIDVRWHLDTKLPQRLVRRKCSRAWPARSTDLILLHLFVWGHLEIVNLLFRYVLYVI